MEGRITKEEAANLYVGDDPKSLFLKHNVEKLKRELASGKKQENPDKLERIKFVLDFYAKQPKRFGTENKRGAGEWREKRAGSVRLAAFSTDWPGYWVIFRQFLKALALQ